MYTLFHVSKDHVQNPNTEILILGTFNAPVHDGPHFFYDRNRNHLWRLLPDCWGEPSLKVDAKKLSKEALVKNVEQKKKWITGKKIDFADMIVSLRSQPIKRVDSEDDNLTRDNNIDGIVKEWNDVIGIIKKLPKLKAVFFTRMTLTGIPNIKSKVLEIEDYCVRNRIRFGYLHTPSRLLLGYDGVLEQWKQTIFQTR